MRPRRLKLKGFTCFRGETVVDFKDKRVFAIVGRTGSGKTTLMDAMCYALYGRVPRGTDPGRLVARGASQMHVSFEFDAPGGRYRAGRTINVSARGNQTPHVKFERWIQDDDWEPLEDRARQMNQHVEATIGLDFKAFERCVLLPQGRFQEMLTGDPADRRRVLEELLDIGIYERIMRRANAEKARLLAETGAIGKMLTTTYADATEDSLQRTRDELTRSKPQLETSIQRRNALNSAIDYANALRQARADERQDTAALAQTEERILKAERLAIEGQSILDGLLHAEQESRAALRALAYNREEHMAVTAALEAARNVERLRQRAATARKAAAGLGELETAQSQLDATDKALEKARAAREAAEAAADAAQRADTAAHLRSGLSTGDPCPVCGGVIGKLPAEPAPALKKTQETVKRCRAEETRLADDAARRRRELDRAQVAHERAKSDARQADEEAANSERQLRERMPDGLAPDVPIIQTRCDELARAGQESDRLAAEIAEHADGRSKHEQEMAAARDEMTRLRADAQHLGGRTAQHRQRGDDAISALRELVQLWEWSDIARAIAERRDPRGALDALRDEANQQCADLERSIGKLEERAQAIADQIQEANAQRARLEQSRAQAEVYALLGDLLQANRFRDWYISTAMTMLADAASRRLDALDSDRRYALGVSNGEFTVIDGWEGGDGRSPETLSGGETFVVALALALALAEQLPQIQTSAGAALESLFLDEGFGTLDPDTLDPVVNALQGLGAEGRTVGIITHVSELAERIGTRIEVTKSPTGSTLTVTGA